MTRLYPDVDLDKPQLRIGIMTNGWFVPGWVGSILEQINSSGFANIRLLIINTENRAGEAVSPRSAWAKLLRLCSGKVNIRRLLTNYRHLAWQIYYQREQARVNVSGVFSQVDIREICAVESFDVIEVNPIRKKFVHRFTDSDLQRVKERDLDVILRFGFNILRGPILSVPKYGVWSYHHGDNDEYRGGPAGFWEMYERNPLTGAILQILTEELDGGKVIYRTYGATNCFGSVLLNRLPQYRKAQAFVLRCLRALYIGGCAALPAEVARPYARKLYRTPSNLEMALWYVRGLLTTYRMRIPKVLGIENDHWFLAFRMGSAFDLGKDLSGFRRIQAPKGRFWADPHVIMKDNLFHVFFEDYDYRKKRGRISHLTIDRLGNVSDPGVVLEEGYHLSYPYVFHWDGAFYLVPEMGGTRTVSLYKAVDFPTSWAFVGNLLEDIHAVDATIMRHEGVWYLYAGVSEWGGSASEELFLFVADDLMGPWMPHKKNPVKSDVRGARPAGRLFVHEGRLFRPAQDCSRGYGFGIRIFEVTKISKTEYEEREVDFIAPNWMPRIFGCHTLSFAENLTVLDGKTMAWNP